VQQEIGEESDRRKRTSRAGLTEWDEKGKEEKEKQKGRGGGRECLRVELLKNSAFEGLFRGQVGLFTPPRHLLLLDSFFLGPSRFLE